MAYLGFSEGDKSGGLGDGLPAGSGASLQPPEQCFI